MLTASLYTNIAFFILFQHYFSVLSNEVSAIQSAGGDVFGNASNASQLEKWTVHDDPVAVVSTGVVSSEVDGAGGHQRLPIFPERTDAVYFVVAVVGGAKTWGRMLAKTLLDLGPPFNNPHGPPLRPIYVDMPQNGRFSSKVLTVFCQQTESRPLAGVIVIGEGQSARAVALAGTAMKLPVLWAKGGTANLNGKHKEIETPFQALLQPSAKEILEAVRAIFLQTHWHSFFVMSDMESSMILKSNEGSSIRRLPLVPTILPLPARNGNIFKQLAEISKSTRGVVLLLCNLETARKIMSEAQRLNMVGGHFIWLWADTSSTTEFYDAASWSRSATARNHGGVDMPSQAVPGNSLRDKSRVQHVTSSQSHSMAPPSKGRQRENERRTDQRGTGNSGGGGRGRKPQQGSGRRDQEDNNNLRRERIHLPVAGRSRPISELNDKSRNRRDFANPPAESWSSPSASSPPPSPSSSSSSSSTSLHNNEQVALNDHDDNDDAATTSGGDNEFYERAFDSDELAGNLFVAGADEEEGEEEDGETTGYAESERRILELLGKAPPTEVLKANDKNGDGARRRTTTSESNRLAGKESLWVDDKWDTGNLTASLSSERRSSSGAADIDPVIKYTEERHGASAASSAATAKGREEEAIKPKRTLNSANVSHSDVMFHHFKDFPIGLLALRPVRMSVDRQFIRATVQLFANTWRHIDDVGGRMDQLSRSWQFDEEQWRRKGRRKRSDFEEGEQKINKKKELLNPSDNDDLRSGGDSESGQERGYSVVNSSVSRENQSFNASDLGQRVNYQRLSEEPTSNSSVPTTLESRKNSGTSTTGSSVHRDGSMRSDIVTEATVTSGGIQGVAVVNVAADGRESVMGRKEISSNFTGGKAKVNESSTNAEVVLLSEIAALPVNPISNSDDEVRVDEQLQRDASELAEAANMRRTGDSDNYLRDTPSVSSNGELNTGTRYSDVGSDKEEEEEAVLSNMRNMKTKRKYGASEQQEINLIRSSGSGGGTTSQRQQILGAWAKPDGNNNNNNNNNNNVNNNSNSSGGGGGRRLGSPRYAGGCYGTPNKNDANRAESFARLLRLNSQSALEGVRLIDGTIEKSLITQFELLNLVPMNTKQSDRLKQQQQLQPQRQQPPQATKPAESLATAGNRGANKSELTKWRRVGLITGTNVQLDTIVWPGGDIVVSGLSARPRSVFRVVTALAPPFVMESELDEDGLCLRGLPCHRLLPTGNHNLTQIFNLIETRGRLEQDAIEHGWDVPDSEEEVHNPSYKTKCCYGLSMDLLENVATELGFQFHLYLVRDELYGAKYSAMHNLQSIGGGGVGDNGAAAAAGAGADAATKHGERSPNWYSGTEVETESDWEPSNADAEKKYFMDEEKIFGQKNPHVFYKLDAEGRRTQFNRDFVYMEQRRVKEKATNERRQKLRNGEGFQQTKWNGIIGDLISGSADMSFAALSVSKSRAEAIDFSAPYFHSGVSLLAAPQTKSEIPLLAFLLPFSPELWIAIFTSLNITAVAVAVYEWLSPFGLNPWGRQRNKNFSMSSALWVMWGLLCGHLVAFKAPKSWPNKFLINVWGGFSVIFVASYTANIAALIAGLFFHNAANKYEASLFTQRLGTPRASAAEMYLQKNDRHLWEHMKKYTLHSLDEGVTRLKNGSLDLLMADSPILDYYRATDPGCNLQRIGETYVEDAYAIGMTKGFPLKDSISELIAKYSSNGYLDILTEKWYGGLPCFKLDAEIVQPRPLELSALAGVYLLLGMGMILGVLILIFEHWFYKYTLPKLRHKPNGSVWKSPNIMFFSQKLYRFINCVELVSPHHAARELVHTLRQGQIASLFQKSIKRKEDEQRRRRKSKAQFFEMIQEIRRINFLSRIQQQHEAPIHEVDPSLELNAILSPDKLSQKVSPKPPKGKDGRSRSNSSGLNVRRFSTDNILAERLDTIGRRLSRDVTNSPPDLGHRFDSLGKDAKLRHGNSASAEMLTDSSKFDTFGGSSPSNGLLQAAVPGGSSTTARKFNSKRSPLYLDVCYDRERERKKSADNIDIMPTLKERLAPPICLIEPNRAELKNKVHAELKSKYGPETVARQQLKEQTQQPLVKPPRRGPLPLPPPTGDNLGGAEGATGGEVKRSVPVAGLEVVKPKIKFSRPETKSTNTPMVVGMTPKIRPTPSPRHVTIATRDSADQTVPVTSGSGSSKGRRNGKSKLSREDLLKISQSGSQAEIEGVYLQNSLRQKFSTDPP